MENKEIETLESIKGEVVLNEDKKITLVKNVSLLLLSNLHDIKYKLDENQIKWIETFVKNSPESISELTNELTNITETGEIDLYKLPHLVKVFANIYDKGSQQIKIYENTNILVIIQYTLDVLINSDLLKITNVDKEVISNIIDTSLFLLGMQLGKNEITLGDVEKKTYACCLKWFYK
jgi:DNA-directed RNA polymerase subunit F